jgi:hypothetical protein
MVQVGDLLDRGDGEAELMDLFERLREEARAVVARCTCCWATTS